MWNAHYFRNDCPLVDGDLVLMDYAPDCGNYTSDIGRVWPVSGRYADWQRELCGFVVDFHKILLRLIRPGVNAKQILDEARHQAEPIVDRTGWSDPMFDRRLAPPGDEPRRESVSRLHRDGSTARVSCEIRR